MCVVNAILDVLWGKCDVLLDIADNNDTAQGHDRDVYRSIDLQAVWGCLYVNMKDDAV